MSLHRNEHSDGNQRIRSNDITISPTQEIELESMNQSNVLSGSESRTLYNSAKKETVFSPSFIALLIVCLISIALLLGVIIMVVVMFIHREPYIEDEVVRFFSSRPTVILISIDGFRHDYLDLFREETQTIRQLGNEGVRTSKMIPSFPSLTFPNHYTMVTGLYPDSHGIVANSFYDPEFHQVFRLGSRLSDDPKWWQNAEPIWTTAEKQGKKAACMFWVGSNIPINSVLPSYYEEKYDDKYPNEKRVEKILHYLDMRPFDQVPSILTMYFSEVDHESHQHGPTSENVREAVKHMDLLIGKLLKGLEDRKIKDIVDVIIVSDHGMSPTPAEKMIFLEDYISVSDVYAHQTGPMSTLWVKNISKIEEIYQKLITMNHVKVYKKNDVPLRFHYMQNRRIGDIVLISDEEYSVRRTKNSQPLAGNHGYDNLLDSMGATFVARGPSFSKSNGELALPFENIHLYGMLAHILDLTPAPNNGTWTSTKHILGNKLKNKGH